MAERDIIPPKHIETEFPVIDTDPHFTRVLRYMRPADYGVAAVTAAAGPAGFMLMERMSPSQASQAALRSSMRLMGAIGLTAGFLRAYNKSSLRFWGWEENAREVEMDMREMVDKVKNKEPLYGVSSLSPYMQGVAARNSRYSQIFFHVIPWFNFVNHNQHGVDTLKYFRAAEEELEAEARTREGRL
ncbi:C-terminal of NADH-ubiquinone oxidoreductase 21 kDa subunit-domain-containing protein [Tricharina praecox]|uniref:C-terminal of NADH-ubiquinone oxidoreductase 21 kDa subunit-domain-containing protein n=1 Tax=Tricharina praecox TaxID=43433 RepID=UPI00221F02FB|nr:C-terminal of NADH-ubiquinone oxidoreductase 21 kDa subunit-domain-containing protein [Tricharina praecox]KAI5843641.1 C-terminal of NADH-ubiquinone oxidoreductase 21 kDa subunit-domain-containing protein [Tricharina praecox]